MAASKILLKGGILLLHDDQDHVHWQKGDLLISGNTIDAIAEDIKVESDVEVIDCGGKLVSPGFIDTHQHVWQAASKGTHCDENMVQYFASGMSICIIWSRIKWKLSLPRPFRKRFVGTERCVLGRALWLSSIYRCWNDHGSRLRLD